MKNGMAVTAFAVMSIFIVAAVSGCTASAKDWSMTLQGDPSMAINQSVYASLKNCNETIDEVNGIPLEIFLYYYGLYPVTAVTIDERQYDWRQEAYAYDYDMPFLVLPDGRIYDGRETYAASRINVTTSHKPAHSSLEIPASIMYSLTGEGSEGLINGSASQIILYYVDALGYERYQKAKANGTINNITALGDPIEATCVYPSISRVNSRALVTGKPSNLTKGDFRIGIPDADTILDRLQAQGKSAVWIDGVSSPVFLGDDIVYRPDTNHNSRETDEITAEAIRQYLSGTNMIFVHFKDTDKKAHAFGPESEQAVAALIDADSAIGCINSVLCPGTVVVVYADHGVHDIRSGGNHGTLLPEDMIVPIVVYRV
ncbi:alkaline phosphatase family protein [Methanocella arvoryzae]|uniref:Metalloenzyme domain-containing protein n=1 Tax=Methanocella arvoryzae (strain DSM 22066 / NBRC 105507 / MRE50) TaxID=351160 RepID=Q0W8J0_METAR|nr:alkaline phosphatase family protein [Methanocella arvoryzae]CAJ35303.1 hypothetical protein LRC331 [Methanocella arvoryzae MRE50]